MDLGAAGGSMVNERQGKEYKPNAHYNRKLLRSMIKAEIVNRNGFHKVNRLMSKNFKRIRDEHKGKDRKVS